ncbi:MAG: N-acetylmuramoyl-L-alanine amidase, partial [Deltaproteobacteria bacterium]|nr:N-acetylmuramoyl-L-alanine amidase [Deltaproteobacteria bacterium]
MPRSVKLFLILVILVFGSGWPACALALNQILNIRHWVAPDHTRVVIDLSEDVPFTVEKGERIIAVDLEETLPPSHIPQVTILKKPGLEGIALSTRPPSGMRVELSLPGPVQATVFKLKKFQDKPYRIVVDLVMPDAAKQESEARERIKVTRKARVVVIDPGHGGDDPGAVGKGGTFEKNVVLAIAKKLRDILNGKEGYRAFLTRDGDYYVSFKKRIMIAREYGADLFVSIHADAARNRMVCGSSVYCLSTGAASSEAARILARNENLADVIGGVPNGEGNDVSDPIILDMFQTHTINQSRNVGGVLLRELGATNRLKFATVQEAPFFVLKLPEIPSILVETAYISNPKEEKLLRGKRFQTQIAEGIARAVIEFLPPIPPEIVTVSAGKAEEPASGDPSVTGEGAAAGPAVTGKPDSTLQTATTYRVKRGDTLSAIAARRGTTVRVLREINHLERTDPLHIGRKLILPAPAGKAEEPASGDPSVRREGAAAGPAVIGKPDSTLQPATTYRVKRGDTLSAIAARHGTTVRVLREINHLERTDPL